MGIGKQALKGWLVTLSVLVMLGLFAAIGAAQGGDNLALLSPQSPVRAVDLALEKEGTVSSIVEGAPVVRASASDGTAFLPIAARMKPPTTLPFAEGFGQFMSPHWTVYPFHGEDWRHDTKLGIYWYNYDVAETDRDDWWGLSMYLGPGSELWADYEVTAVLKVPDAGSPSGGLAGLWLRGSYAPDGRVGGYYVHLKKRTNEVNLWRIRPGARDLGSVDLIREVQYQPGIGKSWYSLRVRVEGANIKAWLKDSDEPDSAYRLVVNWTDPQAMYMQGTVGLSAYRGRATFDNLTVTEVVSASQ
jgi:hypothetical protein